MFPFDIHPIAVHLPIAFLSVYSMLEIFFVVFYRRKWLETIYLRFFVLAVGVVGAQFSLFTGEIASELKRGQISRSIVHTHEEFASFSTGLFFGILIAYVLVILIKNLELNNKIKLFIENKIKFLSPLYKILNSIGVFLTKNNFLFLLASVVGLVAVTVTGALGGALVYGRDADPIITLTLKILNLY